MHPRVAICISGHLRSYEQGFQYLKRSILDPLNPDVFIFTWDTIGFDGAHGRGDQHVVHERTNAERLGQLFQPRKLVIEQNRVWDTSKYSNRLGSGLRKPHIVNAMFYGIHRSNQLKSEFEQENSFVYDAVIRTRTDLMFENVIDIAEINNCKFTNGIYFPSFGNYGGLNDQFAFGSSKSMDMYSDTYSSLDRFFDMGCLWHAETMTKFTVDHSNLPILRTNLEFHLLRADGTIFKLARN